MLARLREEGTQGLIEAAEKLAQAKADAKSAGKDVVMNGREEGEEGEEGEEFTHTEETKRQIKREERKKERTDKFNTAKETCE